MENVSLFGEIESVTRHQEVQLGQFLYECHLLVVFISESLKSKGIILSWISYVKL
jgi:hypothetical protein